MNLLGFAFIAIALLAIILIAAMGLATRMVYGFRWRAIIGAEREAKRRSVMYVSRGPLAPTAVFWLGATDDQENAVALAMVKGDLERADYARAVSASVHWAAICKRVRVWPSKQVKQLLGSPEDVAEGEQEWPDVVG